MRPRQKISTRENERKSEERNLNFVKNERLQVKTLELKHRLCLLEFGLGLIANILEEHAMQTNPNQAEPMIEKEVNEGSEKEAIQTIGKVLYDMERTLKSVAVQRGKKMKSKLVTQVTPPQTLELTNAVSGKPTIFIDEMESGKNSLSGLCSIQVVENLSSTPFPSPMLASVSSVATTKLKRDDCNIPLKKRKIAMENER